MLKKLKLKIILNNMLLVGIVLAMIFSAFCLLVYFKEESRISDKLEENIISLMPNAPHIPTNPNNTTEGFVYKTEFTVFVDSNGNIISDTDPKLDRSSADKAIEIALNSDKQRGNIKTLELSYLKASLNEGTVISFVSREHLKTRLNESINQSIVSCVISLLLFLYISKLLADIAIAPVEEAWKQQKQFIADASHDLKTPLTVILANNNILSAHKDESVASQMKWIESTNEEAGRMSDLINKMLELAKSEANKEELKFGEVDISEVAENSILQFEVVAFERNVSIESGIQPGIIAKTHAPTFSKILEILFDNAIKYSNEGGKISVALYESSKKVHFTINNGGEYIKSEDLPHIFERFYRSSKERKVGGHGLGLSLAKKKCDMIGAKISVESNEIDGTTFTITMKARKQK